MNTPQPRSHQLAALAALEEALAFGDRANLLMACGTGKTLVGRWLAERRGAATTLVVVPSLALLAQTLAEWRAAGGWAFEALITCSDPSTAEGAEERASAVNVSHGAATDVRAWWPACREYEPGDSTLSPDAARSIP